MSSALVIDTIQTILSRLRPAIQNDGGDIEFVRYEDQIVYVKFHGACVHCPISNYTLKLGVEEALKAKISDIKEVIAIE